MKVIQFPTKQEQETFNVYFCTNCKSGAFKLVFKDNDFDFPGLICCVCEQFNGVMGWPNHLNGGDE